MTPDELRETAENYRRGELTPLCEILPAVMDGLAAVMDRIEDVNSELETVRDRVNACAYVPRSMTTDGVQAEVAELRRMAMGLPPKAAMTYKGTTDGPLAPVYRAADAVVTLSYEGTGPSLTPGVTTEDVERQVQRMNRRARGGGIGVEK